MNGNNQWWFLLLGMAAICLVSWVISRLAKPPKPKSIAEQRKDQIDAAERERFGLLLSIENDTSKAEMLLARVARLNKDITQ